MVCMKIICLMPVKNEAWVIEASLKRITKWADIIIVADQHSEDNTRNICLKFDKVKLIQNNAIEFNEKERQMLLLSEARKYGLNNLIFALDADEFIPDDFDVSKMKLIYEKNREGATLYFKWANLCSTGSKYWESEFLPFGFIDDGNTEHNPKLIHSPRVPVLTNKVYIIETNIIHLQYLNQNRLNHKQLWYYFYELTHLKEKNSIKLFRKYTHMYFRSSIKNQKNIKDKWNTGILTSSEKQTLTKQDSNDYWSGRLVKLLEDQKSKKTFPVNALVNLFKPNAIAKRKIVFFSDAKLSKVIDFYLYKTVAFGDYKIIKLFDIVLYFFARNFNRGN